MKSTTSIAMTKLEYCYCDASNYKAFGHVLMKGALSAAQREEILDRLEAREFFIAEQIEVPALYEALYEFSGGPTADDHCWHTFLRFSDHLQSENDRIWGTTESLLAAVRSVHEWDLGLSPHATMA
jgi:hypothetical protein